MSKDLLVAKEKEKWKAIILFGPPGSGKGTLGKVLCTMGHHIHLSSGDIFRGLDPHSPNGKIFHHYAGQGHLVPDDMTLQIWQDYVENLIATGRYTPHQQLLFLDGLPRTVKQAEILDQYIQIMQLIVLDIHNVAELQRRLLHRGTIEKRGDDQDIDILQTRMHVYEKETLTLLDRYPPSLISHFNASQRPIEVVRDVLNRLISML